MVFPTFSYFRDTEFLMKQSLTERELTPGQYFFDQISIGDWFKTGSIEVTSELIRSYAKLSGDTYALHLDDEAAKKLEFPALIAHGILVQGLADGLKFQSPVQLDAVASLGWNIKYSKPVFAGDRILAIVRVNDKRVTSRRDRGVATFEFTTKNHYGATVQYGFNKMMMRRQR